MKKIRNIMLAFCSLFMMSCATTSDTDAVPLRYCEPRFQTVAPIELNVEKVSVVSEFIPSFTRPNVEHLFPVSIEKAAKLWAEDRLKADGFSSNKVAEFIIKDASVTEEIEKAEELLHKDRLKYPMIRKNGKLVESSWEEALDLVAKKILEIKEEYGPDAIAGFSSARTINEDNYLFQKFLRAAVGTNNVDHCARL